MRDDDLTDYVSEEELQEVANQELDAILAERDRAVAELDKANERIDDLEGDIAGLTDGQNQVEADLEQRLDAALAEVERLKEQAETDTGLISDLRGKEEDYERLRNEASRLRNGIEYFTHPKNGMTADDGRAYLRALLNPDTPDPHSP
jgi:chromosome segregation ATPase